MPFLLAGGATAFRIFEREREIFVYHMHFLIEKKLSEASGLQVTLGKLGIGVFQETILENLSFARPGEKPFLTLLDCRFQREEKLAKVKFEKGKFSWKGVVLDNLEGRVILEWSRSSPSPAMSLQKATLKGEFRKGGWVKVSLEKINPLVFKGEIVLQNLLWGQRRLSGMGEVVFFVCDSRPPWQDLKMKIAWHSLTLDDEPIETIVSRLTVSKRTFFIEKLQWGNILSLSGKIGLSSPYMTQGRLHFQHLGRGEIKRFLKKDDAGVPPQTMEGQIFLSGPLRKIHLRGNLTAHEGKIKETDYQKIMSTFYGHWPVVTVESRIEREFPKESSITVRGLVDLGELGKKGFYKTVALEGADAVVWKGVILQNSKETVVFGKENQNSSVTFKTFLNQSLPQEKEEEEFELEYRLRNDKSFKMRFKGDEEFLGLERKTSF